MAESPLLDFVESALRAGASREETEAVLLKAGWARDQVDDALASFVDVDFPVPVPRPKAYLSARDAFLYLVMFGMLYVSAFNFGALIFQFIDMAFPDPVADYGEFFQDYSSWRIRWSTSSLLVAFPIFIYVAHRISKESAADPVRRTGAVRKWLTYVTLFVTACIIVSDLIYLVYSLLSGELTTRFILKALTVGGISGGIFAYYLWTMRPDAGVPAK